MVRPIVVATIGYIIGIITGLYLKSMVLFYLIMAVTLAIFFLIIKIKSFNRYFRYIKLILNFQTIILILISAIIGVSNITKKENEYEKTYNQMTEYENIEAEGVVVSNKIEKDYNNLYRIKVFKVNGKEVKGKKYYCYLDKKKEDLKYGNKVKIKGKYSRPETERNENTFNYANYLKIKEVYGIIKVNRVEVEIENVENPIIKKANEINLQIKENAKKIKDEKIRSIYLGLVLGDTSTMEDELKIDFREAGMAHILAVSGMHISYLILFSLFILKKVFERRTANIITIILIVGYMMITGFSSSIARAGIMGIILLFSEVFYRKNDIATSISLSLLIMLAVNPYLILDVGLQLSYAGTIGIILLRNPLLKILNKLRIKDKRIRYKIPRIILKISDKSKEIIAITLAAQLAIIPISIYQFNLFSSYFIITNFFISIIVGIAYITAIVFTILSFTNFQIIALIKFLLEKILKIILIISQIPKNLVNSKIYVPSPSILQILLYYTVLLFIFYIFVLRNKKEKNMSEHRVLNLIALAKYRYREMNKKKKYAILLIVITISLITSLIQKDLKVNFLDVGQGDATFITTPSNKKILIDGGEDEETVFQYLLKNGYTKIDYIIISHFDSDHVNGIFTVLENLKVEEIIISKQPENSENYQNFLGVLKKKRIRVKVVKKGDIISIEKNCCFKILWPNEEPITENALNNKAIVAKFVYKGFSCLFTGDIESIAENKLVKLYDEDLKATVLKVAHHGSKTSSTQEFLDKVNPKIALIGVGKDNLFGHPNEEEISRIQNFTNKIYRTDLKGEICINFTKKSIIKIKYLIGGT